MSNDPKSPPSGLRRNLTSYGDPGFSLFLRKAFIKAAGFSDDALDRPIVGITNTFSDFNPCHGNVPRLIEAVKRGVMLAGGLPMEFPTISIHESFASPTSMFLRNLMAMDTEEMIRAQPMDAVVLIGGCDKTVPAQLMAAVSADVPAIQLITGPMLVGYHKGEMLGACTDCRRLWGHHRAGAMDQDEVEVVSGRLAPTQGTCMVMGTASTMGCLVEALGIALPGTGSIPATHADRIRAAEASGRQAVSLAKSGPRPSEVLTEAAFRNAMVVLQAIGGSTNGLGSSGGHCPPPRHQDRSGGVRPDRAQGSRPGRSEALGRQVHGAFPLGRRRSPPDAGTARSSRPGCCDGHGRNHRSHRRWRRGRARADDHPKPGQSPEGHGRHGGPAREPGSVGRGDQALGSIPELLQHTGRAVVFESVEDLVTRIDDPDLDVTADDILVLRNAGPKGAPGMPEAGYLPIPKKLAQAGVKDMVRISDARMSGTAFGTIVLHIAPESATGGPLGLVRNGDQIRLDVPERRLELLVDEDELERRAKEWQPPAHLTEEHRGYRGLYLKSVLQADEGCDFDFC